MRINISIEATTESEYQEALSILAKGSTGVIENSLKVDGRQPYEKKSRKEKTSTDSTSDTELSKTGDQAEQSSLDKQEPEIKQEKATKTRYFMHKPNNKTFVIKKGEGLPVEAIHHGDAVELTKAEYDEIKGKKAEAKEEPETESKIDTSDETAEVPTKDEMIVLIRKGMDKKLSKEIKALFGNYGAEKFPAVAEADYPALKAELEKLVN